MVYQVHFSKRKLFYKDCHPNSFEIHIDLEGMIYVFSMMRQGKHKRKRNRGMQFKNI